MKRFSVTSISPSLRKLGSLLFIFLFLCGVGYHTTEMAELHQAQARGIPEQAGIIQASLALSGSQLAMPRVAEVVTELRHHPLSAEQRQHYSPAVSSLRPAPSPERATSSVLKVLPSTVVQAVFCFAGMCLSLSSQSIYPQEHDYVSRCHRTAYLSGIPGAFRRSRPLRGTSQQVIRVMA